MKRKTPTLDARNDEAQVATVDHILFHQRFTSAFREQVTNAQIAEAEMVGRPLDRSKIARLIAALRAADEASRPTFSCYGHVGHVSASLAKERSARVRAEIAADPPLGSAFNPHDATGGGYDVPDRTIASSLADELAERARRADADEIDPMRPGAARNPIDLTLVGRSARGSRPAPRPPASRAPRSERARPERVMRAA